MLQKYDYLAIQVGFLSKGGRKAVEQIHQALVLQVGGVVFSGAACAPVVSSQVPARLEQNRRNDRDFKEPCMDCLTRNLHYNCVADSVNSDELLGRAGTCSGQLDAKSAPSRASDYRNSSYHNRSAIRNPSVLASTKSHSSVAAFC